ncbi:hypothetical protein AGLY_013295 [Aphis glycines]|uniref:Uncharacterized protein n=1 Tax=Aphis glycines TaxID=307491 RepID=A0A6G0T630_APHGL|nr:hypothetical protein AGLY_013295 [Aphis glycines]
MAENFVEGLRIQFFGDNFTVVIYDNCPQNTHPITQNFIMDDFFGESVFDEISHYKNINYNITETVYSSSELSDHSIDEAFIMRSARRPNTGPCTYMLSSVLGAPLLVKLVSEHESNCLESVLRKAQTLIPPTTQVRMEVANKIELETQNVLRGHAAVYHFSATSSTFIFRILSNVSSASSTYSTLGPSKTSLLQQGPTSRSVAIRLFPRPTINKYHLAFGSVYTEPTNVLFDLIDEGYTLLNIIKRSNLVFDNLWNNMANNIRYDRYIPNNNIPIFIDLWLSTGVFGIIDATIIRKPSSKTVVDKPSSFSVNVALLPRLL